MMPKKLNFSCSYIVAFFPVIEVPHFYNGISPVTVGGKPRAIAILITVVGALSKSVNCKTEYDSTCPKKYYLENFHFSLFFYDGLKNLPGTRNYSLLPSFFIIMLFVFIAKVTGKKTVLAVVIKVITYGLRSLVHLRGAEVIKVDCLQLTRVVTFRTGMSLTSYVFVMFTGNVTVILASR